MPLITFARAVQLHQLIRQGTVVLTMVALAQLGLDLDTIGSYESLRFIGYALTTFWVSGLSTAYLRVRQSTVNPERWFVFLLLLMLLGGLLVFALLSTSVELIGGLLVDQPDLGYGIEFGTFLLGMLAATSVEQEAIADKASVRLLWFSTTSYGLQLVLFVGPLLLGYPFYLAMWGLAASAVYRLLWATARYMRTRDGLVPARGERKTFWASANGLSAYALAAVGVIAADHALVGYLAASPARDLAIWRYGAQELPLLLGVVSAANSTALAEMQYGAKEMLQQLRRRVGKLTVVVFPLSLVLMVTSRYWWPWVFSHDLAPAQVIFNTMLLIVPSRLVLTTPLLVSCDLQRTMTFTGIAANVVNVLISIALATWLGMLGIALGTVIAYSLERAVYAYVLQQRGFAVATYLPSKFWWLGTLALLAAYVTCTRLSAI